MKAFSLERLKKKFPATTRPLGLMRAEWKSTSSEHKNSASSRRNWRKYRAMPSRAWSETFAGERRVAKAQSSPRAIVLLDARRSRQVAMSLRRT